MSQIKFTEKVNQNLSNRKTKTNKKVHTHTHTKKKKKSGAYGKIQQKNRAADNSFLFLFLFPAIKSITVLNSNKVLPGSIFFLVSISFKTIPGPLP